MRLSVRMEPMTEKGGTSCPQPTRSNTSFGKLYMIGLFPCIGTPLSLSLLLLVAVHPQPPDHPHNNKNKRRGIKSTCNEGPRGHMKSDPTAFL